MPVTHQLPQERSECFVAPRDQSNTPLRDNLPEPESGPSLWARKHAGDCGVQLAPPRLEIGQNSLVVDGCCHRCLMLVERLYISQVDSREAPPIDGRGTLIRGPECFTVVYSPCRPHREPGLGNSAPDRPS